MENQKTAFVIHFALLVVTKRTFLTCRKIDADLLMTMVVVIKTVYKLECALKNIQYLL